MTNALEKTRTELVVESTDYNVGLKETDFSRRELENVRPGSGQGQVSQALAGWIYRWRIPLSIFIVVGALVQAPLANITEIDNDITAWFSKDDPVYRDYERFRTEFGGTRALIIALKADSADRLFSRTTLETIAAITGDIERVDTVQQVNSLATATIVEAIKSDDRGRRRPRGPSAARESRHARSRRHQAPRARGRSDPRRSRLGGWFDDGDHRRLRRGSHRRGPRRRHPADPRHRRSEAARRACAPTTTAASRSARPTTASRSTTSGSSRRRSCSSRFWRSTSRSARGARRCSRCSRSSSASSGRSGCTR